jgi:hypothetical protein
MLDESFIDGLIRKQRRSKLVFASLTGLASCGGVAGITALTIWLLRSHREPDLFNVLSVAISLMGFVPWKDMKACNDKIEALEMVKSELRKAADAPDGAERNRIDEMLWRCVENTIKG